MNLKIVTDDFEVIQNGSVLIDIEKPLYFKFDNETLNFKVVFEKIKFDENPALDLKLMTKDNHLQVTIKFPDREKFVTSTTKPIHLATKYEKQLFLKFKFEFIDKNKLPDSDYEDVVFNYTWLQK